jgi:hypothetical protein
MDVRRKQKTRRTPNKEKNSGKGESAKVERRRAPKETTEEVKKTNTSNFKTKPRPANIKQQ